jgi:hypothetical protein
VVDVCEHGADCHTGLEPSMASAPEASRAWLLIEHPGPWPHEAADAAQPAPLAALVEAAGEFGLRVQLIRRPGRRQVGDARAVFLGWTAGREPFLRRAEVSASAPELAERDLKELAEGIVPSFGVGWDDPVFLVCTHGKRSVCCARLGVPLAQALAARHPGQVWETTHVGGHRFAANLVILPHGLYYGPVSPGLAAAAIDAYQRGAVLPDRYRGRAGQPREDQEAEYARLTEHGSLPVGLRARGFHGRAGVKRGVAAVRTAVWGGIVQVLEISAVRVLTSSGTSDRARSCRASATIRTAPVAGDTAERPLCRLVQRRACACPA